MISTMMDWRISSSQALTHASRCTFTATTETERLTIKARSAGLADQLGGINLNQTDYNNDGRLDIFVMRGGWEFPMRNSLLRNNR
ncbi:MAG: hypothetical protein WKF84_08950 [Pyrinomonadaceae bacterium]